jgi:hypothetical protein
MIPVLVKSVWLRNITMDCKNFTRDFTGLSGREYTRYEEYDETSEE